LQDCLFVLQVNAHRLLESALILRHTFRMAAMTSFHAKSAAAW